MVAARPFVLLCALWRADARVLPSPHRLAGPTSFNRRALALPSSQLARQHRLAPSNNGLHVLLALRGGAEDAPKKSVGKSLSNAIGNITPTTRAYLLGCLTLAALTLLGVPEELFLFERARVFTRGQFWRPMTSAMNLGKVHSSLKACAVMGAYCTGRRMTTEDRCNR